MPKQKRPKITKAQYTDKLNSQYGRCAICRVDAFLLSRRLCQDHNHRTGVYRGLLCTRCNVLIGMAEENIGRLLDAIEYLNKWAGRW